MAAAACPASYDWAKDAEGLDPCAVATQLRAVCNPSDAALPRLESLQSYTHPAAEDKCGCSSPVYALVSACADCQGGVYDPWASWAADCTRQYPSYPKPVPAGVSIPQWATNFDVQRQLRFDPVTAQVQAMAQPNAPPPASISTPQPQITTTTTQGILPTSSISTMSDAASDAASDPSLLQTTNLTSHPTDAGYSSDAVQSKTVFGVSGASPSATNIDQASSPQSGIKKSNNRGGVIGGAAVGVILLIILVGLLAWWIARRRRSRMAPSAAYMAQYGTLRPPTSMSARPFGDRSNSLLDPIAHSRSNSNGPYHDEEVRESTYSVGRQEPRYTHLPRSSSPMGTS